MTQAPRAPSCFPLRPGVSDLGCLIFGMGLELDPSESSVKFSAEVEAEPLRCKHSSSKAGHLLPVLPPERASG